MGVHFYQVVLTVVGCPDGSCPGPVVVMLLSFCPTPAASMSVLFLVVVSRSGYVVVLPVVVLTVVSPSMNGI